MAGMAGAATPRAIWMAAAETGRAGMDGMTGGCRRRAGEAAIEASDGHWDGDGEEESRGWAWMKESQSRRKAWRDTPPPSSR